MMRELVHIKLLQKKRILELAFSDQAHFELPCEYLRVHSPSAETRGHSEAQAVLQHGKKNINIISIEPVGNYAIKLIFDDGHHTGIYSFDFLYELATRYTENWQKYLEKLNLAGLTRE
ncbi:MAG: protein of unknown function DUF971 [uncultured bacterium]|nr:MAG: protein of unknown function DUF971 [uncultured bacterium]OGT14859.1 MAG: 1-(5-phosphoribosyl)-5-((5-phosphoribosylamino)methylideneamino)imidazole-4-carboxamide isomerase [Gammaproteobacteria bacterium RIFCSPHIGHO2_02_FULL_38_33]OGT24761.1 MAG: 1-(5-phosphoribosyl)-5-((5-phosphoribosylamino)methylideneamino)imidazole-4-carboxamide isomerase [Gammaproteobacteria bacterium RIFCSPHIGHO2_12_38_15]OGT77156.1 MAG: 1-(5-phosphoribosyl)-5-((5-phosphoribosylamino)methylideneamino)imidazole-4-carb